MKKVISFGEIMLRLTPQGHQRIEQAKNLNVAYGGSESNVAACLAQLGVPVSYITRVPDNSFGQSALACLSEVGVDIKQSVIGGDRMGIYFVELGTGRRNSKVMYDRTNSGMHSLTPGMIDWKEIFRDAHWFHWSGITPSISHTAAQACAEAIDVARAHNLTISCDLNYRSKLWKYGIHPSMIMPQLIEHCDVIVGDEDVLDIYFNIKPKHRIDAFELLHHRFPSASYVSFTDREGISATHNTYQGYLYHNGQIRESKRFDIPDIIDRLGTGDAFMAGLIYKLQQLFDQQTDIQSCIDFAIATGVHKHYIPGDINVLTLEDIQTLMSGSTGAKIRR